MENLCCVFKKPKRKEKRGKHGLVNNMKNKLVVLKEPTGREIGLRYELGRELGRDEFGITYLCKDRQTNEELACKSISKIKLRTAIDIEDVRREVEIMRHLPQHRNIVSLKYTYEDDDHVHLLMEHGESPDLLDHLVSRGCYTERSAASIIKTIVKVVQMCHKHGVMHRNLKTENFLCADKKATAYLKVTDFRSSIFYKPGERLTQIVGNLYYMAPEVLKRNYGPEIDIWSAGVILYILLCGFPPFWAETEQQGVAKAITRSVIDFKREPWPVVSDNAKDLVKKMLDPDPKLRLTADKVLDHPWLIEVVKMKYGVKDLVKKMFTAHEVLDHPWLQNAKAVSNVSLGETVRAKLLQFSIMNQLTKTTSMCYQVIAKHLSAIENVLESEISWVRDTGVKFSKVDNDEVRVRLHKLGQQIPDVDVQRLLNAFADVDENGYLDYGEFLAVSVQLRKISHEEHVDRAFRYFDKKQSGYIELEELHKALADEIGTQNKKVIKAIMHDVATDEADTDSRKASRQYSRERFTSLSLKLRKELSLEMSNEGR